MYRAEIARTLAVTNSAIQQSILPLVRRKIVEPERRGQHTYYQLRPGMVEQYEEWLALPQEKPIHALIIELLKERDEMQGLEMARRLSLADSRLEREIAPLIRLGVVARVVHQRNPLRFYQLVPDNMPAYEQWVAAQQQQSEPEP